MGQPLSRQLGKLAALAGPCPHCHAPAGKPCVYSFGEAYQDGAPRHRPHVARYAANPVQFPAAPDS